MSNNSKTLKINITPLSDDNSENSNSEVNLTKKNLNTTNADEVFTPSHKLARSPTRPLVHASTPLPILIDCNNPKANDGTNRIIVTRARQRALSLEDGFKGLGFELGIGNSRENLRKLRESKRSRSANQESGTSGSSTTEANPPSPITHQHCDPQAGNSSETFEADKTLIQNTNPLTGNDLGFSELLNPQGGTIEGVPPTNPLAVKQATSTISGALEPLNPTVIISEEISELDQSEVTKNTGTISKKVYWKSPGNTRGEPPVSAKNDFGKLTTEPLLKTEMDTTIAEAKTAAKTPAVPSFVCPQTYHPSKGTASGFLNNYDRTAIANGWDNTLKIAYFGSFLEGAANLWYKLYTEKPTNHQKTWDNIKDDFLAEFDDQDSVSAIKYKLENRKQQPNEKVKDFFYELSILYYEYDNSMDESKFIEYFEKGLSEQSNYHYYWLTHPPNQRPRTFEEIKELAATIDKAPPMMGLLPTGQTTPRRQFPQNNYQGTYAYNNNRTQYTPGRGRPNFNRPPPGPSHDHMRNPPRRPMGPNNGRDGMNSGYNGGFRPQYQGRDNFNPRARMADTRPRCFTCGGIGHLSSACPNPKNSRERQT